MARGKPKPEKQPKKHALTPAMEAAKFKPGQSGNPNGRPRKGLAEADQLNGRMDASLPKDRSWMPAGWKHALEVADQLWPGRQATFRDLWHAVRLIRGLSDEATAKNIDERLNGKPTQPLANDPDNPLFTGGIAEAVQRANGELGKDDKAGG